jgi:hypothetical protein
LKFQQTWKHIGLVVVKIKFVGLHHRVVGVHHVKGTGTVKGGVAGTESVIAQTGIRRLAEAGVGRGDIDPSHL